MVRAGRGGLGRVLLLLLLLLLPVVLLQLLKLLLVVSVVGAGYPDEVLRGGVANHHVLYPAKLRKKNYEKNAFQLSS